VNISFTVTGEPKAQPRPKAFARNFGGGKWQARVYDPGTAEAWKSLIALEAKRYIPDVPLQCPVAVQLVFLMPRPKGHYRSNGELKPTAPRFHTGRPDCDNLAKAVLDCLTQLGLWRDDGQVSMLHTVKRYAGKAPSGAEISINTLPETEPIQIGFAFIPPR
jgi:Holliday junction resolvase RusA-like endonuclease